MSEQKEFMRVVGMFFAVVVAITGFCFHSNITERSVAERNYIETFSSYDDIRDGCVLKNHSIATVQEEQNGKRVIFTINGRPDKTEYFVNKDMTYSKVVG